MLFFASISAVTSAGVAIMRQEGNSGARLRAFRHRFTLLAVLFSVIFWFLESGIMTLLFNGGPFVSQLVAPRGDEIWHRLLVIGCLLGFSFYASQLLGQRQQLADEWDAANEAHRRLQRKLGARLCEVEESERRRLARELHDQVGPNLIALGLQLKLIDGQIPDEDESQAHERVAESLALLEDTGERIRGVMSDLRPPVLDDYGLVASLKWYASEISRRTDCLVEVTASEADIKLPGNIENALFRIAQEALTNVCKHARASRAGVSVEVDGDVVRMVVADNGVGFDPAAREQAGPGSGWGLLIMAERAEMLGGRCRVQSLPEISGTRVMAEMGL